MAPQSPHVPFLVFPRTGGVENDMPRGHPPTPSRGWGTIKGSFPLRGARGCQRPGDISPSASGSLSPRRPPTSSLRSVRPVQMLLLREIRIFLRITPKGKPPRLSARLQHKLSRYVRGLIWVAAHGQRLNIPTPSFTKRCTSQALGTYRAR